MQTKLTNPGPKEVAKTIDRKTLKYKYVCISFTNYTFNSFYRQFLFEKIFFILLVQIVFYFMHISCFVYLRLEEQKKQEAFEKQLELMHKKVESRKFLFEQADEVC